MHAVHCGAATPVNTDSHNLLQHMEARRHPPRPFRPIDIAQLAEIPFFCADAAELPQIGHCPGWLFKMEQINAKRICMVDARFTLNWLLAAGVHPACDGSGMRIRLTFACCWPFSGQRLLPALSTSCPLSTDMARTRAVNRLDFVAGGSQPVY